MARLTSDWTERRAAVAAAMVATAAAGGLATLGDTPYDLVGLAAVMVTVLAALSLDAFGGIVAGFVGAGALIAARQLGGDWTTADFGVALLLTVALVVVGWITGLAGAQLREKAETASADRVAPAYGSLGLVPANVAMERLDEEVARARRHRRPLTVVLIRTEITDQELSETARGAVQRTVARLVESLVPETAVPFALAVDEIGAILPETDEVSGWELLGPVVDAAGRASFTAREDDERRSLADCAALHAGLVQLSAEHADAVGIVAAARVAVGDEAADDDAGPAEPDVGRGRAATVPAAGDAAAAVAQGGPTGGKDAGGSEREDGGRRGRRLATLAGVVMVLAVGAGAAGLAVQALSTRDAARRSSAVDASSATTLIAATPASGTTASRPGPLAAPTVATAGLDVRGPAASATEAAGPPIDGSDRSKAAAPRRRRLAVPLRPFPSETCRFGMPAAWAVVWADLSRLDSVHSVARDPDDHQARIECTAPRGAVRAARAARRAYAGRTSIRGYRGAPPRRRLVDSRHVWVWRYSATVDGGRRVRVVAAFRPLGAMLRVQIPERHDDVSALRPIVDRFAGARLQ